MTQDKYTMDPGRQVYLNNKKIIFVQKYFWTTKSKKCSGKFFFSEKNLGNDKIWDNKFLKKNFFSKKFEKDFWNEKINSTSRNYT